MGSTSRWVVIIAAVAGLVVARSWLRGQFQAAVQEAMATDNTFPESPDMSEMSNFTIDGPIVPENYPGYPSDSE